MSVGANLVFAQTGTSRRKRKKTGDGRQGDGRQGDGRQGDGRWERKERHSEVAVKE
jgi:hypothetical protein